MSDKAEGSIRQAMEAVNPFFSAITKAWSAGDTGAAANNAVAAMSNPAAAQAIVTSAFDGGNPFQVTG